jgi:protein SCO1/2
MSKYLWPALAGLFLFANAVVVNSDPDFTKFSHDDALAYSQQAIGTLVEDVVLTRGDGSQVSLQDYRGKPLVISLIFTSCHHICPATTQHLREVADKARAVLGEDSFELVTVGFDVANDNPERMAQFRRSADVDDEHWSFLSGDAASIDKLVHQLGFIFTPSARGFDHLIQTSIIDRSGAVYRQVYGITFPIPQLIEPLKELVFNKPASHSALDYLGGRIRLFCTVYDPATDSYYIDISVFIGTFVGLIVSLLFGRVLFKEWRKSIKADQ